MRKASWLPFIIACPMLMLPVGTNGAPVQTSISFLDSELLTNLSRAVCASSEIRGKRSSVESAKANVDVQKAEIFPKVRLEGNYLHMDKTTTYTDFDITRRDIGKSSQVKMSGSLTIYDGGLTPAKIRAAEKSVDEEVESVAAASQDLMLKIVDLYYKKKGAIGALDISRKSGEHSDKLVRLANFRLQGGIGNTVDLALAEARDARVKLELVQAENNVREAEISLQRYTRVPPSSPCLSFGEKFKRMENTFDIPSYEEATRSLHRNSARLRVLRRKIEMATENIEVASRSNGPSVRTELSRSVDQNSKDASSYGQRYSTWYGGVIFSYPIFSGFSVDKQTRMAVAEKAKSQDAYDEALRQEIGTYQILYGQISDAEKEQRSYLALLRKTEIAVEKSVGRFQYGIGSISDALLAQSDLIEAKRNYIAAKNRSENIQGRLTVLLFSDSLLYLITE